MNARQISEYLRQSSSIPVFGTEDYQQWLRLEDAIGFLTDSINGSVPVYISVIGKGMDFFLYSAFAAKDKLVDDYPASLLDWNLTPASGWGYGTSQDPETGKVQKALFPPLDHTGTPILDGAEPIIFSRHFYGYKNPNYLELSQRFAQLTDSHWVPERQAYCRYNEVGDLDSVVRLTKIDGGWICTVERDDLDFYMAVTDTTLVRVFDVIRTNDPTDVPRSERREARYTDPTHELYARRTTTMPSDGVSRSAWLRGAQVIRTRISDEEMATPFWDRNRKERKYESFIAFDFKHDEIRECSADPKQLGNYFVQSGLPFGTSPAFFKPDVLARYQQNPDKYSFDQRVLRCRGAWSLRYGINDESQVFAYLIDLSYLPHSEQVYWKSFNEEPKAGISQRALKSDFLGEWDPDYDPLESLQYLLAEYPKAMHRGEAVAIWAFSKGMEECGSTRLHYIVTDSPKEWKDQIIELAKVLPEGLNQAALRGLATHLGCFDKDNDEDKKLRSIALLQRCLEALGEESSVVAGMVGPLREIWQLRSSIAAHASAADPPVDRKTHYQELLERCEKAMQALADCIRTGKLNIE